MPGTANIDSLDIKVKSSADVAANKLEKLASSLAKMDSVLRGSVAEKVLPELAASLNSLRDAAKNTNSFKNSIVKMSAAMDTAVGACNRYMNAMMDTAQITATTAAQMQDIGSLTMPTAIDNQTAAMTQLTSAIGDLVSRIPEATSGEEELEETAEETTTAVKKESKGLKSLSKAANGLSNAFSKATAPIKNFIKSIGRIALYRAIRTAIKNLSAAVKEGLTNLKTYSETVGTAYATAVNDLKRHTTYLKNAFATTLRPVIEAVIPLIIKLCNWLAKAADFMAQVFSVMTGKVDENGRYTKAILGDLEESNEQAKELRRTLLGFDEINRLDGDTGSSSSTSTGLQFEQADVSAQAVAVAEKLSKWVEKIKEFINGIDWATVLKVIAAIWAIVQGVKLAAKLKKVWDLLKSIGAALGGVSSSALGIVAVIAAVIAIFGLWGDKISEWCKNAKKAVKDFFKETESDSKWLNYLGDLLESIASLFLDIVGDLASAVYKLVHGDFVGAWEDLKRLFGNIVINIAGILDAIINIVINAAAAIYNDIIAPLINKIATAIEKVHIWLHNAVVDVRIGFLTFLRMILVAFDSAVQVAVGIINGMIDKFNELTGSNIKPIEPKIDTTIFDAEIERLENTKLDPITEDVEIAGKWTPTQVTIATDLANKALDALGIKVNKIGTALASQMSALQAMSGYDAKSVNPIKMYASGGYPSVGTMFIAGESGPEYVGDIGGRTGVMNSDQMAAAMYQAMNAALANNAMNNGGGDIYLDGEVIYRNVVNRNNNRVRSTGRSALLT